MSNGPLQGPPVPPDKRRALGKGLAALLPPRPAPPPPAAALAAVIEPAQVLRPNVLNIGLGVINPTQPRTIFQPEKLEELAQSIRANGIIQPLIVRQHNGAYELIAGERRLRAAKIAGMTEVPVVIQDLAEDRILEVALIENIQREDLNAIELAIAYDRLNRELSLTHEEIGRRTGKDRTTITNFLRLLRLPAAIQDMLSEAKISMGHARCILALRTDELQRSVADKVVAQGLSVRATEALVQSLTEPAPSKHEKILIIDPNVRAAEEEVQRVLGTRVRIIAKNEKRGRIEIEYYSPEELDRIYQQLVGEN